MGDLLSPIDVSFLAQLPDVAQAAACDGLLVAFSGGVDSTALLALLVAARARLSPPFSEQGPLLAAVHVHHGLLPEADGWALHAQAQCAAWGLPCFVERVQVSESMARLKGLEAAARQVRFQAIAEVAKRWGEELRGSRGGQMVRLAVVLGHHRDDQVETFWFRLLRGAGVQGLAAMTPWSPFWQEMGAEWLSVALWRPFLTLPKAALQAYALKQRLLWVDDPSNATYGVGADPGVRRNFLRLHLLPQLRRLWPGLDRVTVRTAQLMAEAQQCLDDLAALDHAALSHPQGGWQAAPFWALPPHRQHNLLRWAIRRCSGLPPPQARLSDALRQLVSVRAKRQVALTATLWLAADRHRLWLIADQGAGGGNGTFPSS